MTRNNRSFRRGPGRYLSLAALVATTGVALSATQAPSRRTPNARAGGTAPQALTADLVVSHHRTRGDGRPAGVDPAPVLMRLVRRQVAGRWRTTLTLREGPRATALSLNGPRELENPFAITRMEVDDDGRETRFYDAAGRAVAPAGPDDRRRLEVPGHLPASTSPAMAGLLSREMPASPARAGSAGLLASRRDALARRGLLTNRVGPSAGRLRGLDRFVSVDGDRTREWLLDPQSALPVEVITTRAGRRESHVSADYERVDSDRYLRRSLRADRVLPDASGDHLVTTVVVTDVSIGDGGQS